MRLAPTLRAACLIAMASIILNLGTPANATSLVQCNKQVDGSFVPVLMVEQGGKSTTYKVGDKGLTRSMIFNERKAMAWAGTALGLRANDYHACGFPNNDDRRDR